MKDYMHIKIEDIIEWCKDNNQITWLKEEAAKKVECKVYPRIKNAEGKMIVDKTKEPKTEVRPIPYIQLKKNFVEKFMPEMLPHKDKKPTMYEIIANL